MSNERRRERGLESSVESSMEKKDKVSNNRLFGSNKSSDFLDDFMINKEPTLNDSPQSDPFHIKFT